MASFPAAIAATPGISGASLPVVGQEAKAPAVGGIVGTFDPNYQTLAGVGADVFEDKGAKPVGGADGGPKAPTTGGIVGTNDPNYQTLAGVAGDVFEDKGKKGGGDVKVPEKKGEAGIWYFVKYSKIGFQIFYEKDKILNYNAGKTKWKDIKI